jgi:mitochondrial fission protein ELM1
VQENETTRSGDAGSLLRSCWVLTDGAAGNERQALALAQALSLPARNMVLPLRAPWSWLAPRLTLGGRLAVAPAQRAQLSPPWPDLVIGCGRAAALLTRLLPALSAGHCRSVQILDPRINPEHWDLVIAPQHDNLSGPNVLTPLGSLHPVDASWLAAGREASPHLAALPQPRIGVLLGGTRHGAPLDSDYVRQLAEGLRARQQGEGGSLMLLASRRTPPDVFANLKAALVDLPGMAWGSEADGANPYPGVLGWADRLVVTPDSVNMLSEASACGRPVHTLVTGPLPDKLAHFHAVLRQRGLLHDLDTVTSTTAEPLRETAAMAAAVRARLETPRHGNAVH